MFFSRFSIFVDHLKKRPSYVKTHVLLSTGSHKSSLNVQTAELVFASPRHGPLPQYCRLTFLSGPPQVHVIRPVFVSFNSIYLLSLSSIPCVRSSVSGVKNLGLSWINANQ